MLITPDEWENELFEVSSKIKEDLSLLAYSNSKAINFVRDLEPLRITAAYTDKHNQKLLNLYFFHPEVVSGKELLLLNDNEYIEVDLTNISNERNQIISIPEYWSNVSLMINDSLLSEFHILKNKNIIYTLKNEIIPFENEKKPYLKFEKQNSEICLNEVQWNNLSKTLNLELAKKTELKHQYSILISSEIIWKVDKEKFHDQSFVDSSFVIKNLDLGSNVLSISFFQEDQYKDLEYIVLDSESFIKAKNKNNKWEDITHPTFGSENKINKSDYDASLIPEFFVLYQNYPNPFNGETRISFDLINNAIVSLFISDAKGRIHERFLDKKLINSGQYNFTWNGEKKSTGIYFVTLQAQVDKMPPAIFSRKMIYLK